VLKFSVTEKKKGFEVLIKLIIFAAQSNENLDTAG